MTKVIPLPGEGMILDLRILPIKPTETPVHVAVLCLRNLVISFAPDDKLSQEAQAERFATLELAEGTPSGLLCAALLFEARRSAQEVRAIRARILELDQRMDRDPDSVGEGEIIAVKVELLGLLAVAEEQSEFLGEFNHADIEHSAVLDFGTLKGTLRLARSLTGATERLAERLEKRVNDLRQRHDSHQQDRLNHRLAVLTVLSAIFLPLTLVAGIWGMNFETMPELRHPWGYPAALCLMASLAGAMVWLFRRGGWLR
jgi:Mg2+ and Co2+ transporter CorA